MDLSFVIPNFNCTCLLPACLKSLPKDQEIIIIDNASTDNSLSKIKELKDTLKIKKCKLIINQKNLGFAKAVNQGILAASNPYVALINTDIVLSPHWQKLMIQAIKSKANPQTAVFSGLVLNHDGKRIESEGLQYFWRGKCLNINNDHPLHKSYFINRKSRFIWGANAACTIYRRQILIDIGLFDENFFAYEEDVDLCLRLNKLGYQTLFVPLAISYHTGGATSSQMGNLRWRMDAKNWIYIIIKNYSLTEIVSNLFPLLIERLRNLSGLIKHTPLWQIIPSLISTYGQIFLHLPRLLHLRRQLAKLIYDHRH